MTATATMPGTIELRRPAADSVTVGLEGDWRIAGGLPDAAQIERYLADAPDVRRLAVDSSRLGPWGTGLLTFLVRLHTVCSRKEIALDTGGLPGGARRLLEIALAVPPRRGAQKDESREPFLSRVGKKTIDLARASNELLAFIGEAAIATVRMVRGKAVFRRSDLVLTIQESGASALPIVTLISLLVGLILAFIGAIQLSLFGAEIYVADLVGIGMVRVLGAVMTGIIMAGRTGAAFAAQLGTMQVNEEIDALRTLGISPMEFLVLPRMVALVLMMPLLCLYADLMGVLGGLVVGIGLLGIDFTTYYNETRQAVTMPYVWIGLFHGIVFGVIIALAGCLRGMQCGRSASAVGEATTSAVVTAIVGIIVATAIITFIFNLLNI